MLTTLRRVVHPSGVGSIGPRDMAIDADITLYARTFHIIGCDAFTRTFMQAELSRTMALDQPFPSDPTASSLRRNMLGRPHACTAPSLLLKWPRPRAPTNSSRWTARC